MDEKLAKFIEKQKEIQTSAFNQAKSLSNIVIFGGYAGLFTVWNFTKDELARWQTLSVGLLTIFSLTLFIFFELYRVWITSLSVKNLMGELTKAEKMHKFPEEFGKSELERAAKYMQIWPFFFFGAALTALAAAIILVYAFVVGLICGNKI